MSAIIPTSGQAAAALAAMPALERSAARHQALSYMPAVLERMDALTVEAKRPADRIAAAKFLGQVSALTSTTNLPRDVVKEKFERTVDVLREFVPESQWADLAGRLRPIWSDV